MDKKKTWLMMAVVLGLTWLWLAWVLPWLAKKNNWDISGGASAKKQPAATTSAPAATSGPGGIATTGPTSAPIVHGGSSLAEPLVLGYAALDDKGKASPYPLGLKLTNRGAAIDSVTLNRFRDQYDKPTPYVFQQPYDVSSPLSAALATRSVSINGGSPVPLDNVYWEPSGVTDHSASFSIEVSGLLRITKTYEIRPANDKTAGYEVLVTYALANLSDAPLKAKLAFNGTNSPRSENSRDYPEVVAGFVGSGQENVVVAHSTVSSVKSESPLDVKAMNDAPLLWSGVSSAYFEAVVRATDASGQERQPLAGVKATWLNTDVKDSLKHDVALSYETPDLNVPPSSGSPASFVLNVFVGPKSRDILNSNYYVAFPRRYDKTLVLSGGMCAICTWAWLINVLVSMLQGFHYVLRDWGLAIIALVVVVRLVLHPITKKSQISMSRMTKMGPEMERLKVKHKDDPDALKKAQMDFYREQGVAPFLGCLPMFLQMPIWIALWSSLQSTFEIRHAPFLWGWTWIRDLSQPDRLIKLAPIDFYFIHLDAINILPILMAVVFFIQQKLQPQPVAATPEQAQQQKMMKWMSIFLFPLFLYSQPSGLNLYIFTSTFIGIFESKRIRDHIREKEEREKAGVVIVDAPPAGKGQDRPPIGGVRRAKGAQEPAAPAGLIGGFFAKLQHLAAQAKQEQDRRGKKGGKR